MQDCKRTLINDQREAEIDWTIKNNNNKLATFYSISKSHRITFSIIGPLVDWNGILHSDTKYVANILQSQYCDPNSVDSSGFDIWNMDVELKTNEIKGKNLVKNQ